MLRIAICDDDPKSLEQISQLLQAYFRVRPNLTGRINAFTSGKSLLEQIETEPGFDLYLLDILMPGQNGIEIGRRLREAGSEGEIIYLSTSDEYAVDSYDVQAFFYLLKPADEAKFFRVLDAAIEKQAQRKENAVMVTTAEGVRRILLERIRYVERIGRIMRYDCTDGAVDSLSIRSSFRDMVAPLLADRRFCLCGASFVLNFHHVSSIKGQSAILDNGKVVALPRKAATDFKRAWGNYWLDELDK